MFTLLSTGLAILLWADATRVDAQENTEAASQQLTIGSPAPTLDVQHWVQDGQGRFKKVTEFEAGKVYVVEFWATWCGPCIASMPHLAETQQKYADKGVQLISISDEELETVEEFLKLPVRKFGFGGAKEGDQDTPKTYKDLTSVYCLTTDPDQSSYEDYMIAAGENGIPTAFIVGKDGIIEWIGHPMEMDEPLEKVVAGSWDRAAAIAAKKKEKDIERLNAVASKDMLIISAMLRAKNYERALKKFRSLEEKLADQPAAEAMLIDTKLEVQISADPVAAIATLDRAVQMKGDDASTLNDLTWMVYEILQGLEEPNQDFIKATVKYAEQAVKQDPTSGPIIDTLAHLVYLTGDLDRAIELQTKAVKYDDGQNPSISEYLDELKAKKREAENQ